MSDEFDQASDMEQTTRDRAIAAIRRQPTMPAGYPGDCDLCGEYSQRLVDGACAPCRDKYHLD